MANDVQNSLLTAIDTIIGRRIEELELDKTVIASIEQCTNSLENQYRVQYKGGSMYAYAQKNESYTPNTSVYVSIPQNNFSEKKWIIGRVTETVGDFAITEVSTAKEDFQIIGNNIISVNQDHPYYADKEGKTEIGLWSYRADTKDPAKQIDVIELYNKEKPENENLIFVNQDDFKTYLTEAQAVLLEATFRTDLDLKQQKKITAEYGLIFSLEFDDADASYPSMEAKLRALESNIKYVSANTGTQILFADLNMDVKQEVSKYLDQTPPVFNKEDTKEILNKAFRNLKTLKTTFSNRSEVEEEYVFITQYQTLINEMLEDLKADIETWAQRYRNWLAKKPIVTSFLPKEITYSLYSDKMLGNPYLFNLESEQYDIFNIDTKRFKNIHQVLFYCKDFNLPDPTESEVKERLDIFVKDIEFYALKELTSINGDYKLKLKCPRGQVFANVDSPNLIIGAQLFNKLSLLTTDVKYYWFIKDGLVQDSNNEHYHVRGGIGWRLLNKTDQDKDTLTISQISNTAYENAYKCVAVYQETITLKSEFTIFNNVNKRTISITSDLGTRFKFDNGIPTLTCKILDNYMSTETEPISIPESYQDYLYSYIWMRRDYSGKTIVYDKTYEALKAEYEEASIDRQMLLKSQLDEMEGVTLNKNMLTYPVNRVKANEYVTFDCYVYRQKVGTEKVDYIGVSSIVLKNDMNANIPEYHIIIENGDQVFQYSESGVSPCNDRIQDPVKPKNLICHFYDPNGLEVNSNQYTVSWKYPIDNSLIIPPKEGLKVNPANNTMQMYYEETAPIEIAEVYDYALLNNQIVCYVEYNDIKVDKETALYFGKIGDNGTNGTDLVAKIEPIDLYGRIDNEPLTLITINNTTHEWNSGIVVGYPVLQLKAFNRNELIDPDTYKSGKWKIAGGTRSSNRFLANADGADASLCAVIPTTNGNISNYIVRGQADITVATGQVVDDEGNVVLDPNTGKPVYEDTEIQTIYAFYPVCIIDYTDQMYRDKYPIRIDKERTLKQILYNADGRNPMYNKNQGVFFDFSDRPGTYHVSWTAKGGFDDAEMLPAFDLVYDKECYGGAANQLLEANTPSQFLNDCPYVYIKPKDVYGGDCQNNYVEAKIYVEEYGSKVLAAIAYIPLYIALNRYGLASLNAWDGNTIEINEDENYIMAPQIGAGIKEDDEENGYSNVFTGIVMGKATTYDDNETQVGLLGYSKGRQSIFLDAKTGNATFGLPEQDERNANVNFAEGRVELRPGGLSSIAKWKFNSRMLFNVPEARYEEFEDYNTWGGLVDAYDDLKTENLKIADENYQYIKSIPHKKSGIILSSRPSYVSVKGRQLTVENDGEEKFLNAGALMQPGDSFELEINPNLSSLFTIWKHSPCAKNSKMQVKLNDNDELYIGLADPIEWDKVPKEEQEKFKIEYSVPIYSSDGSKTIIGWNALLPDPDENQYLVATPTGINSEETVRVNWLVRGVHRPGAYRLDSFDNKETDPSIWWRDKKVYIDDQGRFCSNALKNSATALNIDAIGAFGMPAVDVPFIGASFEVGQTKNSSLIKMFVSAQEVDNENATLYISTGTLMEDEYARPMNFYGQEINLYADSDSTETKSNHRLEIKENKIFLGHQNDKECYGLSFSKDELSNLKTTDTFTSYIGKIANETPSFYQQINSENKNQSLFASVMGGSVENKIWGRNAQEGNVKTYATGNLEFYRTDGTYKENSDTEEKILIISKALSLTDNSLLFGDKDDFQGLQLEVDEEYEDGEIIKVSSPWFGNPAKWLTSNPLCSDIIGTRFESNDKYSLLATDKRFGIYSQDGLDIQELGGTGLRLKSKSGEEESYLQLTPSVENGASLTLSSKHGIISIKSNARGEVSGSQNGIELNPGLSTGFGIFNEGITGEMSAIDLTTHPVKQYLSKTSILANGDITTAEGDLWAPKGECWAEDFIFNDNGVEVAKKSPGVYVSGFNTNIAYYSYSSVWSHIEKLYALVSEAMYRANDAYNGYGTVPSHNHDNIYSPVGHTHDDYATEEWVGERFSSALASARLYTQYHYHTESGGGRTGQGVLSIDS